MNWHPPSERWDKKAKSPNEMRLVSRWASIGDPSPRRFAPWPPALEYSATKMSGFSESLGCGSPRLKSNGGRKPHSRYHAAWQLAADSLWRLTQGAALPESRFALGYYISPLTGLSISGFADSSEFSPANHSKPCVCHRPRYVVSKGVKCHC